MKIAFATPFYEVKAYSPYISSLLGSTRILTDLGIEWDYYELSGDSYVDRAKNSLINRFLNDKDFTHIFMIDSDLAWDQGGFARIIKAGLMGAEVVGGTYPNKNNWNTFGCIMVKRDGFHVGLERNGMRLLEAQGIPGGFILYSRSAFERTRSNLQSYVETNGGEPILECFKCNIENGIRLGEDIYFQQRYREMGGKVWLEPNISFKHIGVAEWFGNYHQYLLQKKGVNETNIHVVTQFSRNHLKDTLVNYYKSLNIIWHPLAFDDEADFGYENEKWIIPYKFPRKSGDIPLTLQNNFIRNVPIIDDDYYVLIPDDDLCEPNVFEFIKKCDDDVIVISMKRGNNIPANAAIPYPTDTLYAKRENMKIGGVGAEQLFCKGNIFKDHLQDETKEYTDGILATHFAEEHKVRYEPDLYMLFNFFEPGRWGKA